MDVCFCVATQYLPRFLDSVKHARAALWTLTWVCIILFLELLTKLLHYLMVKVASSEIPIRLVT